MERRSFLDPINFPVRKRFPKGCFSACAENIKVMVRCRPFSSKECRRKCRPAVTIDPSYSSVKVTPRKLSLDHVPTKIFYFDHVFPPGTQQHIVYDIAARPIIQDVLEGYNATIFAYGQTGTGKTFTMEGISGNPELEGIIPKSFSQIFSTIENAEEGKRYVVQCSYLEIYNENIHDLLGDDRNRCYELQETNNKEVCVNGLTSIVVTEADDMERLMSDGNKNRIVASTKMNSVSSRSHTIFSVIIECTTESRTKKSLCKGKLNLVDLAGSERIHKTNATGDRLTEAKKISLSLSNLVSVISALVEGNSHIPYRNSKLTRLLQGSLGGNSKTVMLATIGPADYNYEETVNTLQYANRAKNVCNCVKVNKNSRDLLYGTPVATTKRKKIRAKGKQRKHEDEFQEQTLSSGSWNTISNEEEERQKAELLKAIDVLKEDKERLEDELDEATDALTTSKRHCEKLSHRVGVLEKQKLANLNLTHEIRAKNKELKAAEKKMADVLLREACLRKALTLEQLAVKDLKSQVAELQGESVLKQTIIPKRSSLSSDFSVSSYSNNSIKVVHESLVHTQSSCRSLSPNLELCHGPNANSSDSDAHHSSKSHWDLEEIAVVKRNKSNLSVVKP